MPENQRVRDGHVRRGMDQAARHTPFRCGHPLVEIALRLDDTETLPLDFHSAQIPTYVHAASGNKSFAFSYAEKARPTLDGAIVLIGNAPLALARIARYALEEGVRPALVVGMPVGFVNVVESKELLAQCDVPQIVLEGRRGGSALAVTTLHAVMESA